VERRPERVVQRLTHRLGAGDILLLHDGNAARDRHGRPVVLEALPRVLDFLEERGLRAIPLPA
jgi:peptidoglycan/xylan/chitin deacetylase (PgdA/CDA1 family)